MTLYRQKQILIFCIILIRQNLNQEVCTKYKNNLTGIEWPSTDTKTLSKPICLDENREFVYRKCVNGEWESEPKCFYTQQEKLPDCPDGFIDTGTYCYHLTKTVYPPKCPFNQTLSFSSYKEVVDYKVTFPVWVPAKRDLTNGFGFILWTEPGHLYKTEVSNYVTLGLVKNKNCLLYYNKTFVLASCNEENYGICIYKKLDQLSSTLCIPDSYCIRDFGAKSKCFCKMSTISIGYPRAEFLKPYQYNIYGKLTNETCAMGLIKNPEGKYIWRNSGKEIEYTFWSKSVDFSSVEVYGAATPNGWILTRNPSLCTLFEVEVPDLKLHLRLEFIQSTHRFQLQVLNAKAILSSDRFLHCFTDADPLSLLFRYPKLNVTIDLGNQTIFEFEPVGYYPGNYWCEAFSFTDLAIIKSNVFFFRPNRYPEFVATFVMRYEETSNPLSNDTVTAVHSNFFATIKNNLYIMRFYKLRIVRIINLNEESNQVEVNVHFSSNFGNETVDEEDQYKILKNVVDKSREDLKGKNIKVLEFLSADFCESQSNHLTWPKAYIGTIVNPAEYCFTSEGKVVTRLCDGNFIDGGRWSDVPNCELFKNSSITQHLLTSNLSLEYLYNISSNYQNFEPLDVYLIGRIYTENTFNFTCHDVVAFANTISNLVKIKNAVLTESQLKLGATDNFLQFLQRISLECNDTYEIYLDNFVHISLENSYLSGLAVERDKNKLVVYKLTDDQTVLDLVKRKNLEGVIWLSAELRKNISQEDKVTFWVFSNDSFFQQRILNLHTGLIFGMAQPKNLSGFKNPVQVLYRKRQDKDYFCGFWSLRLSNRGYWSKSNKGLDYGPFVLCQFPYAANYALISINDNDNVTDDLIDLLDSNDTAPQTLDKLFHISEKHEHFKPIDVSYVGQILQKINYDEKIDLVSLAFTVSNLHKIERKVLKTSQVKSGATDLILANIDIIIQKHTTRNVIQIMADNFMVFVVHFKKTFNGLALLNHKGALELVVLEGNISIGEIAGYEDFDSAVVFSPELKKQIPEGTKVIITSFFNDALFNDKFLKLKYIGKVFGVILPIEKFHGPVSIYNKTDETSDQECAFWNYSIFSNIFGSWTNESKSIDQFNLTRCDFWHTTHFAQLILDVDRYDDSDDEFDTLSIITSINCIISLISLSGILLTALFFKRWRENTGNQILLNFTFVIILQIVIFYVSNSVNRFFKDYYFCTVIGMSLHYSTVSQFCWMLVIAVLQFRRFVTVLEGPPRYILLKACICGWVLPLVSIVMVFVLDNNNYVNSNVRLCYPSGFGLYLGVWLPVSIIIVVNFVIFTITIYNVVHKKTDIVFKGNNEAMYQWRLAVMLFFILGLTWGFAFLSNLEFGLVFEYLFCFTATLQGFIIFLFFIVFNVNTRYLYINVINKYCKKIK